MNKLHFFRNIILVAALILLLTGCRRREPVQEESTPTVPAQTEFVLNTLCTITLYDWGEASLYQAVFARLREIEYQMSAYIDGSGLDRINKAAGIEAVQVEVDLFNVIERAIHYAEISGGAFDPTVLPLANLWGIGGANPRVPAREEIEAVLPLVNWRNIELDRENRTVFLTQPGMALDLGAIAKGYAADEAAAIIIRADVPQALVNLGGNVVTVGRKLDETPWRIGIQNPLEDRGAYFGIAQTWEKTIVTSGIYEQYFIADGQYYHHIFSPTGGYPARSGLLAVTIIADNSMDADALSTAVFVLGYRAGRALIESLDNVDAIFVLSDRNVSVTSGANFILRDDHFTLIES